MLQGYIVPHAPVLLLDRSYPHVVAQARALRRAVRELMRKKPELVVVISPHGKSAGVYGHASGSLDEFGLRGYAVTRRVHDQASEELRHAWGRPLLDAPADHGIVVPLLLLGEFDAPLIAVTMPAITDAREINAGPILEDAAGLAGALQLAVAGRDAAVFISAHTSAALSPSAPLLDRPAGHRLHKEVLRALQTDVGKLTDIGAELWEEAGSCGAGPLAVAGRLWPGTGADVRGHGSPAGVGYVVADVSTGGGAMRR